MFYTEFMIVFNLNEEFTFAAGAFRPAKFIIFDTEFLVFDTEFLVFDTQFIIFTLRWPRRSVGPARTAPAARPFSRPPSPLKHSSFKSIERQFSVLENDRIRNFILEMFHTRISR